MRIVTILRLAYMVVGLVAIALRWSFVEFVSGDFTAFLSRWWAYIDQHGHLAALRDGSFSNYNPVPRSPRARHVPTGTRDRGRQGDLGRVRRPS